MRAGGVAIVDIAEPAFRPRVAKRNPAGANAADRQGSTPGTECGVAGARADRLCTGSRRAHVQPKPSTTKASRSGRISAGTSTGGYVGKRPGRVGDSALIGAGTYADNRLGGVSTTGHGEAFIRTVLAKTALDILRDLDDPEPACHVALDVVREDGRGDGGLILLDWRGRLGWAHSTPFMPVGWCVPTATEPVLPF